MFEAKTHLAKLLALLETLEILADEELSAAVAEGLEELSAGRSLTHEEVWAEVG